MGLQFDWTIDDEQIEVDPSLPRRSGRMLPILIIILLLVSLQTPNHPQPTLSSTITFAVPSEQLQLNYFRLLAASFMREHPEKTVNIVGAADFDDPTALLAGVDAAILTPDIALLQTRMLYPLDELTRWDSDFYDQSRAGVMWDGGIWVWPYALQMNVLYSDALMQTQGSLDAVETWNFVQFGRQINLLADRNQYGFLLSERDILFSYAYAHGQSPLDEATINDTLAWANGLQAADNAILDLSGLQPLERQLAHLRNVSAERTVALWSDGSGQYEYLTQLNRVNVAPWPHSDTYRSVAPLRVHGGVVSATSQNPPLAMAWLDFISHQPPSTGERLIPARQSVAQSQQYWDRLPPVLTTTMSDAFDSAQAITISDHSALSWERINQALANNQ